MDFLKTFVSDASVNEGCCLKQEPVDEENVELSLGLSLNGRFGVERRRLVANTDRLVRASSVVNLPLITEDETTLTRTYSLPIAAEEWWKRKELFSLRRSEAKRKRVEKLKNGKMVKENGEMKKRKVIHEKEVLPPLPRLSSGGSPASGGSSGVYDVETQHFSGGLNKDIESKSSGSQQSILHHHQISSSTPSRSTSINENHWRDETLKMMLSDMPCVSTKENGVDGKKIEGFLYRYRKGEEVRIVCVCHGSFLTPAEFVKHGGGGDVEHPLRHIVVNPPSL